MFQALFNSLSGLFSFSRNLDTVSDNIANMNTPGFRGSDTFFSNVGGGLGTSITGEGLRTTSGKFQNTGVPAEAAIDGAGFFILRSDEGELFYTRAGQFHFDDDGILKDSVTGYQVMTHDLTPIDRDNFDKVLAVPTQNVDIKGNIAPGTASHTISDIKVYSATGGVHTLTITLEAELSSTNAPTGAFKVVIKENGNPIGPANALIKFDAVGHSILAGFDEVNMTVTLDGKQQTINFDFGTPGDLSTGTRNMPGLGTALGATVIDGHAELGLAGYSFDDKGMLKLAYSATEKRDGPQLGLARFAGESRMHLIDGRLISGGSVSARIVGRAGDPGFGKIKGGYLELANVDLTQEFADMIIIQRGYQASSRVMTVSNEMIEQLYNSTRGG
jgi:flagellar hook protein FlgE